MTIEPGDGERRAMGGYWPQYLLSASLILKELEQGDLEWIRPADPTAGQVDDIVIGTTGRVDAYQVKWRQYGGTVTFLNLTQPDEDGHPLFKQLSEGWKRLRQQYPTRRVVVHLATNRIAAYTSSGMPDAKNEPKPYTIAAFIEQSWFPTVEQGKFVAKDVWEDVWKALQAVTELSDEEFSSFVKDCRLDFGLKLPEKTSDIKAIHNLIGEIVSGSERVIELDYKALLSRLGWQQRYSFRNQHIFPEPEFLYRPIEQTVKKLQEAMKHFSGGYIGVFGPPGSGKSTFLTQTLRM